MLWYRCVIVLCTVRIKQARLETCRQLSTRIITHHLMHCLELYFCRRFASQTPLSSAGIRMAYGYCCRPCATQVDYLLPGTL